MLKKKQGFTLIEIILALAISSLLFLPILTIFISMNNTFTSTTKLSISQSYANIAMETIKKELKDASNATLSHSLSATSTHKYIYVNDGVMVIRTVTETIDEKEIIRRPDLNEENMVCSLLFTSNNGKAITVNIKIIDETNNNILYALSSVVYLQNSPYGITLAVSPNEAFEYFEYTEPSLQ